MCCKVIKSKKMGLMMAKNDNVDETRLRNERGRKARARKKKPMKCLTLINRKRIKKVSFERECNHGRN
jgi:hypothetical protein